MQQPPNYQQQPNNFYQPPFNQQVPLPNATAVLVLGICSIVLCFLYGVPGIICGIIALILGNGAKAEYERNPQLYTISSFNNMKAGRTCAIIGLSLSVLYLLLVIFAFVFAFSFGPMAWH